MLQKPCHHLASRRGAGATRLAIVAAAAKTAGKGFGNKPVQQEDARKPGGDKRVARDAASGASKARPVRPEEAARGKLDYVQVADWGDGNRSKLGELKMVSHVTTYEGSAAAAGEDGDDADGEASAISVGAVKEKDKEKEKDGKEKKGGAKEKPGAKGGAGKDKKGGSASHTDDGAAPEPGAGLPNVEHLQPVFHDKATTAAKAAIKAALNTLLDEVHRHKVAAGDALEANIRSLDSRIEAAQADAQANQEPAAAEAAAAAGLALFAPAAGGVPAPGPGPAARARSAELEQLYWERLCVLRTWTGLGIPTRADVR